MSILALKLNPLATDISFTEDEMHIILADGRELAVPLEWFPKLRDATAAQRNDWRFIGDGIGIHWESIDEDIAVSSLLW